jgi:hypothetical protein
MSEEVLTLTRLVNIKYYYGVAFPSHIYLSDSNLPELIDQVRNGRIKDVFYCEDTWDGGYLLFNQNFNYITLGVIEIGEHATKRKIQCRI